MNRKISAIKNTLLLIVTGLAFSPLTQAEVINNSHWLVKPGESVYGIARKMYPNDTRMQARFRKELINANPDVFADGANNMSIGSQLVLPTFARKTEEPLVKQEPAQTPVEVIAEIKEPEAITPDPEENIGRVVINIGDLEAVNRGQVRKLKRHSKILKGDTLRTASYSRSQIRMKDGALISLSPNTHFQIAEYNFNGQEDGTEKSFFNLIKGGFRTITGLIGHRNKQNYQVKTTVATIGIRGTHYGLMLCQSGSCSQDEGLQDGLYGGVVDGSITTNNQAGEHQFTNDQYFHIAKVDAPPIKTLAPPPIFKPNKPQHKPMKEGKGPRGPQHKPPGRHMVAQQGALPPLPPPPAGSEGGDKPPILNQPPVITKDILDNFPTAPPGSGYLYAFNATPNGVFTGSAITTANGNDNIWIKVYDDGNGLHPFAFAMHETSALPSQLTRDIAANVTNISGNLYDFNHTISIPAGPSTLLDGPISSATPVKVNWGRWNATNVAIQESGNPILHNDMHFVFSPDLTPKAKIQALSGTLTNVSYNHVVGFTRPTDTSGTFDSTATPTFTITAHFDSQLLDYQVETNVNSIDYAAHATGIAFDNLAKGFALQSTGTCSVSCAGQANFNFIGPEADGAITTYTIHNSSVNRTVSGAAVIDTGGT